MPRKPVPVMPSLQPKHQTRLLKKYPNRRLYDTAASRYVTLAEVRQLVIAGEPLKAVDAKTGEDITRSMLLQIILEAEAGGAPMFTEDMLAHIIRFHGYAMQGFMGGYLEKNIQVVLDIQSQLVERAEQLRRELMRNQILKPEAWVQFMGLQSPLMQELMNKYLEQSKTLFVQMQQQITRQIGQTLAAFGFKQR